MYCLLSDIRISKEFRETKCNPEKIMKAAKYIEQYHINSRPIILDDNGTLIDGYATYLAAKMMKLNTVVYNRKYRGIVYGRFYYGKKIYAWNNPKNLEVKKGDIIIVENKNTVSLVKVEKIGYADCLPEKNVLYNLSENDLLNMLVIGLSEYVGIEVNDNLKTIIVEDDVNNKIADIYYRYEDESKLIRMGNTQKKLYESLYFLKSLLK